MSEYLDRQQVIDLYEKHHSHLATYVWEFGQELRQLPIVEERPHGEWIKFTLEGGFLSSHKCSNCGFHGNQLWHFCPNCGADMRKEKENEIH